MLRLPPVVALGALVSLPAQAAPQFAADIRLFEISQPDGVSRAIPAVEQAQPAHVFYLTFRRC